MRTLPFKVEIIPILHQLFQKREKEGLLPRSFYKANITPIMKPNITRKGSHRPVFLMRIDRKFHNKILTSQIQPYKMREEEEDIMIDLPGLEALPVSCQVHRLAHGGDRTGPLGLRPLTPQGPSTELGGKRAGCRWLA